MPSDAKKKAPRPRGTVELRAPERAKRYDTPVKKIDDDFLTTALDRAERAFKKEQANITAAYEDLEFAAGDQWPEYARRRREAQNKPILTINRCPQFVRQVTGDIRLMKPAIKAAPIDARGTTEVAELITGMIRYIENRSEAQSAYNEGAESQVRAGIGHWRITTEYAEETTFNQEIRIVGVDDGITVLWDDDSKLPTREDAMWCFVPVVYSRSKFNELWPDCTAEDFNSYDRRYTSYWATGDDVRVSEYWEKREATRTLALHKNGAVDDLTDAKPEQLAKVKAEGAKVVKRRGYKVFRSLITLGHVLEKPKEWAGRMIPIIPVVGEEVKIGRKVVRYGIIRFAKDPQRLYNFMRSQQAEVLALAPKAPWLGTKKNFEGSEDKWEKANEDNFPYLEYTPDPMNSGAAPQRNAPPVTAPGLSEGAAQADGDMKAVTGIYDSSLGQRSNETSGVAIRAREQQGDVGNVVYVQNFSRSIRHTGRVLVDLIPHVYDTERQIQIMGEDGHVDTLTINKAMVDDTLAPEDQVDDPIEIDGEAPVENPEHAGDAAGEEADGPEVESRVEGAAEGYAEEADEVQQNDEPADPIRGRILNDVTIGAYGIVIENGPSYTTKREEAQTGMADLIKSAPDIAPLILDLYAKAQDWPLAQEIAERIETMLPPPIQAILAKRKRGIGEVGKDGQPHGQGDGAPGQPLLPPPPSPEQIQQIVAQAVTTNVDAIKAQSETAKAQSATQIAQLKVREAEIHLEVTRIEAAAKQATAEGTAAGNVEAHQNAMSEIVQRLAALQGMIDEVVDIIHAPAEQIDMGETPPQAAEAMLNAAQEGKPVEADANGTGMSPEALGGALERAGNPPGDTEIHFDHEGEPIQ